MNMLKLFRSKNIYHVFFCVLLASLAFIAINSPNQAIASTNVNRATLGKHTNVNRSNQPITNNVAQTSSSVLGFNYWPYGYFCDALNNSNWQTLRPIVAADLDHIASLSGGVIRIMFWPQLSGFKLQYESPHGYFTNEFYEQTTNVVDLIRLAHERNIKVIVAFGNNYFDGGNGSPEHRWWMNVYPDSEFASFLNDTNTWINGFVNAIEQSPYNSAVIYYDYENEYNSDNPYMPWYVVFLYDWSDIPAGKRGISVLSIPKDVDDLHYQLNLPGGRRGQRHLDYVDFHSYPTINTANSEISYRYDYITSKFPGSIVLLGEFGSKGDTPLEETVQVDTVVSIMNTVRDKNIAYYLNWTLYPFLASNLELGWGYNPHSPKDVMGTMSSLLNLAQNPDMEVQNGAVPAFWGASGWSPDGSTAISFYTGGPNNEDAATNLRYARVQANQNSGAAWLSSALIPVTGGKRVFANAFIRSNMYDVRLTVVQYDTELNGLPSVAGPPFTPVGWSFNNYLHRAGSSNVLLDSRTKYIVINVSGNINSNPSYLDVDTVSVWQQP